MTVSLCVLTSCEPWRLNLNNLAERSPVFNRATWVGSPFHDTGNFMGPPLVPAVERQLGNNPGHDCGWTMSKKRVTLLLARGRFEWPLLPISAGHGPRVGSEALGKCDLLFHYILPRPMSRAGFWSLPWSWGRAIKQWLLHGDIDSLTGVPCRWFSGKRAASSAWPLISTPAGSVPSQHFSLAALARPWIENKTQNQDSDSSLLLFPTITIKGMSHFRKPNWRSPAEK